MHSQSEFNRGAAAATGWAGVAASMASSMLVCTGEDTASVFAAASTGACTSATTGAAASTTALLTTATGVRPARGANIVV